METRRFHWDRLTSVLALNICELLMLRLRFMTVVLNKGVARMEGMICKF